MTCADGMVKKKWLELHRPRRRAIISEFGQRHSGNEARGAGESVQHSRDGAGVANLGESTPGYEGSRASLRAVWVADGKGGVEDARGDFSLRFADGEFGHCGWRGSPG